MHALLHRERPCGEAQRTRLVVEQDDSIGLLAISGLGEPPLLVGRGGCKGSEECAGPLLVLRGSDSIDSRTCSLCAAAVERTSPAGAKRATSTLAGGAAGGALIGEHVSTYCLH
jgi:hypothetical protein